MDNKERAAMLQESLNVLANIRVPVAMTQEISMPIHAANKGIGAVIRDMLEEAKGQENAGSPEHEEART